MVKVIKKSDKPKVKQITAKKSDSLGPVFGYRFVITGDFNGDGKPERISEHFFSNIDHKETNKFYRNTDFYALIELAIKKKPNCFLSCSDKSISDLPISTAPQFGLAYLKNEGDLNGDGTDEVSYIVNWADWSALNTCSIMTYKNNKWQDVYSFYVWGWPLPDIPGTHAKTGPSGRESYIVNDTDEVANKKIAENLKNFKGLIKKIANNKIQIICAGKHGKLDTAMVDLNKPSRH